MHYYNENDPFCVQWLRNLMAAGLIPEGHVDDRSIKEVQASDLTGYVQCHFFAGVAGWPLALQMAGFPVDAPIWTGSCPCQPFSAAGKRKGHADERHLWPEFYRLIKECKPQVVFGEQVASAEVIGTQLEAAFIIAVQNGDYARANKLAKRLAQSNDFNEQPRWIDGIQADLAKIDYSFRFKVLGAHSQTAPHIRQRLFWVAESECVGIRGAGRGAIGGAAAGVQGQNREREWIRSDARAGDNAVPLWLADNSQDGRRQGSADQRGSDCGIRAQGDGIGLADRGGADGMGVADRQGSQQGSGPAAPARYGSASVTAGLPCPAWSGFRIVPCSDGSARRVGSGVQPMAYGIPVSMGRGRTRSERMAIRAARANRTGRLRAFGNAIVPQVAAEFIRAYLETRKDQT